MDSIFNQIEALFKERYKGWDGADQFEGSGERLRRLIDEMCWPMDKIEKEVSKCLKAVFDDKYDEMLVCGQQGGEINVWTLCPHHILPCNLKVKIGYIPVGKVLGLSKFTRIATAYGKRPIMQEQYTRELADLFMGTLEPEGLGVYVTGKHGCMGCRGVNQEISIVTSTLRGSFKKDPMVREEFYSICRG